MSETQKEYLDRICGISKKKPPKSDKRKAVEEASIFGYNWEDIQAMQQRTYKRRLIK